MPFDLGRFLRRHMVVRVAADSDTASGLWSRNGLRVGGAGDKRKQGGGKGEEAFGMHDIHLRSGWLDGWELDRVVAGRFPAGTGDKVANGLCHRQRQAMEGRFYAMKCIKRQMNGFGIKVGRRARRRN
ncbi:hypothetical protein D3C81_1845170 [compost metagenome]